MKRLLSIILLTIFPIGVRAAYQDIVKADQPTGYWRLGEPAGSAVATNLGSLGVAGNGTIFQNVTFGQPGALNGNTDTAANFDANQAKIDVAFASELNTPQFTVEAWAK